MLRADRQFLDQELEVVVAGERHDLAVRIGRAHAQRRRHRPAQRAGLAAIDPVARLVDVEELRAGDLRQADRADVAGVAAEGLVHLLIDPLRLERDVVEMGPAQHVRLRSWHAAGQACAPAACRPPPFLGDRDEQLERRLGIGDDAEIGIEDAADLGRLDVDMHECAALGVGLDRCRCAGWPSDCRCRARSRTPARSRCRSGGWSAARPCRPSAVVVGNRAPAHQRRHHRHAGDLGEARPADRTHRH